MGRPGSGEGPGAPTRSPATAMDPGGCFIAAMLLGCGLLWLVAGRPPGKHRRKWGDRP